MWQVTSNRLAWPHGEVLGAEALAGCNIDALVAGGHLAPVPNQPKRKRPPADPAPDDQANQPEEQ